MVLAVVVAATHEMQMAITVNTKVLLSNRYYQRKYLWTGLIYFGSFLLELLVFLAATYSLATAKDVSPPVAVMWAAILALFLAFMLPYSVFQLRVARRRVTQLARDGSGQSETAQAARAGCDGQACRPATATHDRRSSGCWSWLGGF